MKYSALFGKTIKSIPSDAQLASHQFLVKGGFVRRISTGRWSFLPLGMKVWEKVYRIIDEEMKAIGCQKLVVPTLHPIEIWQASNRDKAFGEEMLVVDDHHGSTFAIGATAEGVMLETVKMFAPSYKDLPIEVYQFSSKFRDDKRPRGGIMRVREFMMKDAYSFCADEKQADKVYQKYFDAYLRIAKKLDLKVLPVEADSGAIGGSVSHEFMVESKQGDQTYFVCDKCGYSANVERAEFKREDKNPGEEIKKMETVDQPEWVYTMDDNIKHYGAPLWQYLKNVVYKDETGKIYIASVRGDQEVNEIKLKKALGVLTLKPADDSDLKKLGTKHGYVHSWDVPGATFVGDLGLKAVRNFIGGHKEEKTDTINVNYGQDFKYELADIVDVKEGDLCPRCNGGKLKMKNGFEWGHTFNIGYFYSKPQKGNFVDQKGKQTPLWMGSYGIGIERTIASIIETHHDEKGIVWPKTVAPYQVHLIEINGKGKMENGKNRGEEIYKKLNDKGVEVLWDEREDLSAGEKFADADLIGIPVRLVISERNKDKVEWKERDKKESELLDIEEILARLS